MEDFVEMEGDELYLLDADDLEYIESDDPKSKYTAQQKVHFIFML